ncbi:MAG: AAA family ATPase, partial [Kofleriaceae bacterium]
GSASELLTDRIRWSAALLGLVVDRGREEGWLAGGRVEIADPDAIEAHLSSRLAATEDLTVSPLDWMVLRLELGPRERVALWLLACLEVSPAISRLVSSLVASDVAEMTLQLLRQVVPLTDRELAKLEALSLVQITHEHGHQRRVVRATDRVVAFARGELELDPEVADVATIHAPEHRDVTSDAVIAAIENRPPAIVVAVGPQGSGRSTLLAASAGACGIGVLRMAARALAGDGPRTFARLRAFLREASLFRVVPMIEDLDDADPVVRERIIEQLRAASACVMLTMRTAVQVGDRPTVVVRTRKPERPARRQLWESVLPEASAELLDEVADAYALWPGAIVQAASNARALGGDAIQLEHVRAGVRAQIAAALEGLATRVDITQSWDDLVLPEDQLEQVAELVARVRHRARVYEGWGLGPKVGKGCGVAAMFSGPPGTGKTMAAGLVARELGLDLYQVDLSKIVSKYIGETEKQLAALFEAAETGQALVLFDEADSLFAKRSDVKSSNDRYANLEVNYLLQRIEAFTGIAILTTNHERAIDDAFRRRLAVHVRFPIPDATHRAALWRTMMPDRTVVADDIDFAKLGREFEMSGGHIKNAVVRAAFTAAAHDAQIGMELVKHGALTEFEAMGKLATSRA